MARSRNPPRFITGECFTDNLLHFGDNPSERVTNWLAQSVISELPYVISPLHTPNDGRKPHVHFILDVSNAEHRDLTWYKGLFKSVQLPFPEDVRNIFSMEHYLTHDTAQSRKEEKETFTSEQRDTMVYGNGYAMHELTDRSSREETTKYIGLISCKIEDYIDNGGKADNRSLARMLRDPDFYCDINVTMPLDMMIAKAKNELKTHYRYYLEYAKDYHSEKQMTEVKNLEEKQAAARAELRKDNRDFCTWLCGILDGISDNDIHHIFYDLYGNDREFRAKVKEIGMSNLEYRLYLDNYIQYCGMSDGCSDRLFELSTYLDKYTVSNIYTGTRF